MSNAEQQEDAHGCSGCWAFLVLAFFFFSQTTFFLIAEVWMPRKLGGPAFLHFAFLSGNNILDYNVCAWRGKSHIPNETAEQFGDNRFFFSVLTFRLGILKYP